MGGDGVAGRFDGRPDLGIVVTLGVGLAAVATIGLLDELEAQRLRVE
jgi:hypothetical protein